MLSLLRPGPPKITSIVTFLAPRLLIIFTGMGPARHNAYHHLPQNPQEQLRIYEISVAHPVSQHNISIGMALVAPLVTHHYLIIPTMEPSSAITLAILASSFTGILRVLPHVLHHYRPELKQGIIIVIILAPLTPISFTGTRLARHIVISLFNLETRLMYNTVIILASLHNISSLQALVLIIVLPLTCPN